ncbi:hypothetical protein NQ315_005858 [Exocentrus adspersus]|uniref:Sodium channel protein Nach n=1 Tax=Exocentrus adspersus TaxID=1586481 RepID=A0AAV8VSE0_9CUCU|nr:hypothetical protein NQ315_005858 [Exocentrus adspersus]
MDEGNRTYKRYQGLMKNIRSYCREYCDYTGIHGFKYFGERRSLCENLVVCIGVIYKTYIKWQFSPVIVNFATEEKNIYQIPFPAVTICHEVKISREYFNYSKNLKAIADGETLSPENLKKLQYMSLLCSEGKTHYDKIPKINITDDDFYNFLDKGSAEFFDKCIWMGNVYPCYEIFYPIITDEGLCFTFNMLNKEDFCRDVEMPQPVNQKYQQMYKSRKVEDWTIGYGYGDLAGVDTYPRRALLAGSTNALIVNLNVSMADLDYAFIVAISPTEIITSDDVKEYSVSKRKCFFQSEKRLKFFKYYTQYNCKLECLTNITLKICGCVAFYMPHNLDMAGLQHSINTENNKRDNFDSRLKCDCSPMCASVEYNVEITEIDYDWYKEFESLGYGKMDDEE